MIIYYSNFLNRLLHDKMYKSSRHLNGNPTNIKAIRSSKKHRFVKKEFQLITNTDINNNLKILSEMGRKK